MNEELTSKIVEIRIVTTESETSKPKKASKMNVRIVPHDQVSLRSDQEIAVEFGDDTLESVGTARSNRQSTLFESIERVLNESYEIVIEDNQKKTEKK